MKKLFYNFYVGPITIIYIAIALVTGRFYFLFIHLVISLIHELFHVIGAKIFKVNVEEITMYPFGFMAKIEDLEQLKPYKQLIILILGPLSYFFSILILKIIFEINIISLEAFKNGLEAAKSVLFFNLIPIYPFDGNRILYASFSLIFEEKLAQILKVVVSIVSSIFLFKFLIEEEQFIIIIFIVIEHIRLLMTLNKNYQNFLLLRLYEKSERKIKISTRPRIYRHYENYYLYNNVILDEKQVISLKLSLKKQKKDKIKKIMLKIKKNFS